MTTPRALLCAAALTASSAAAAVDFQKEVWPFIEKRCVDCHRAPYEENGRTKEPKAGLRLDGAWAFTKGSENGPVLKAGDSAKSSLYEVVTLPKDDDMHMPPKGDPLTDAEVKLLKQWIDEGASFGTWEGNIAGRPADMAPKTAAAQKREHDDLYKALEAGLKPVSDKALTELKANCGAQAAALSTTSALLRADFLTGVSKCTDEKVAGLAPVADYVAHLDLARTAITDQALMSVAKLPRLVKLDLRGTKITDKGLEALSALKHLRVLNLFGTEITDAGLAQLTKVKSLRQVFTAGSKVTEEGAKKLMAANKDISVSVK